MKLGQLDNVTARAFAALAAIDANASRSSNQYWLVFANADMLVHVLISKYLPPNETGIVVTYVPAAQAGYIEDSYTVPLTQQLAKSHCERLFGPLEYITQEWAWVDETRAIRWQKIATLG